MNIGLVVDGVGEFAGLPNLYDQLFQATGHRLLAPVRAKIPPYATNPVIARSCTKEVVQLLSRRADRVVVLLDREQRPECCGELADEIARCIKNSCGESPTVVVKDRTFENWVVADIDAIQGIRGRFTVSRAMRQAIDGGTADTAQALVLLKQAARGDAYDKVQDAKRILERAAVNRIAANSRSFRRFLRVIEHHEYREQSARAVN